MGYVYEDCLEIACMDRFHCGLDELQALVPVYSELASLSKVDFRKLACMNDLHAMVEYAYTTIRNKIAESIRVSAKIDRYVELVPDDENSGYVKYEIDDKLKADLIELANKIKEVKPQYKDLTDVKFNSIIDEAIDWESYDSYPEDIAERVLQLAYDEGLLRADKEYKEE